MNIRQLRGSLIAGVAALALAACSGGPDEPAPPTEAATETAPDATASEAPAAVEIPAGEATLTPAPTPTLTPTLASAPIPAPTPSTAAKPVAVAAPAAPPASFARCAVCHSAEKGAADKLGPNLYGTFGNKMGQGSFAFSDAVKNSGLTLDEATLDKWLENPRALVPGNRMSFPGLKDAAKRKEIIDYLKQQR